MKTLKRLFLLILIFSFFPLSFSSCKSSSKDLCYHESYKKKNSKKNRSNYSKRYSYKPRPVKKDYVIKNKSRPIP